MTSTETQQRYRNYICYLEQFLEDDDYIKEIVGRLVLNEPVSSDTTPAYLDWFNNETIANAGLPVRPTEDKPGFCELIVDVNGHCQITFGKYEIHSYAAISYEKKPDICYHELIQCLHTALAVFKDRVKALQEAVDKELDVKLSNKVLEYKCSAELEELKALQQEADIEHAHSRADDILVEIMEKLGYNQATELWKKIPKLYA